MQILRGRAGGRSGVTFSGASMDRRIETVAVLASELHNTVAMGHCRECACCLQAEEAAEAGGAQAPICGRGAGGWTLSL